MIVSTGLFSLSPSLSLSLFLNEWSHANAFKFLGFPVDKYSGTKSILISTRTVMGGKNPFLGIAYLVVGGICILLGAVFLATHLIKPRKLGDHTYLTWNNDQPSTATTTGRQGGA
jgi:hypothetical protein